MSRRFAAVAAIPADERQRVRIADKLRERRPAFSFEFFPPKDDAAEAALYATVAQLKPLDPAYVSITYGAGGSTRRRTVDLAKRLQSDAGLDVMAHVTLTGSSVGELRGLLGELRTSGIDNVLALRGDPPKGETGFVPVTDGLTYSSDLAHLASSEFNFCVGGAAYPEKHPESVSIDADLHALTAKVRAGCQFFVTQLFFDNARYFEFVRRARDWGITIPIVPGIMPITNYTQLQRFTTMCGATIPAALRDELEARRDAPEAVLDLGVAYASLQVADLIARGAPGVHFYTLNRSPATRAVLSAIIAARSAW